MRRKMNFKYVYFLCGKVLFAALFFAIFVFSGCPNSAANDNAPAKENSEIFKVGSADFKMIKIPAVEETLLGDSGQDDNKPHKVSLNAFWIAEFETVQELYDTVMGGNYPWAFSDAPHANEIQKKRPCDVLTWYECAAFCNELTKKTLGENSCVYYSDEAKTKIFTKENAEVCKNNYITVKANVFADWSKDGFRLPTEAEWAYAARGGKTGKYAGVNEDSEL